MSGCRFAFLASNQLSPILPMISILLMISEASRAQSKLPISEIYGYLDSNFEADSFRDGTMGHAGEIGLNTQSVNGFHLAFSVLFSSDADDAELRRAMVHKDLDEKGETGLAFGFGKKKFGWEYEKDKPDLITIERSPLYRRMELFSYVGRESLLEWSYDHEMTKVSLSLGHSSSKDTSLVASHQFSLTSHWHLAYWVQVQSDLMEDGHQFIWALMGSMKWRQGSQGIELETLIGVDPEESALLKIAGEEKQLRFSGLKLQYDYLLQHDPKSSWRFVAQSSLLYHDLETLEFNTIQALVGVNYSIDPIMMMLNLEAMGSNSKENLDNRTYSESAVKFALIYVL